MIRFRKPVIWITRTQPSASKSALVWADAGFKAEVLPLLDVAPIAHPEIPDEAVLVFTSKNGVDHMSYFGHRAVCVGDATAAHAEARGFRDVVSVNGTSADITRWILENLPREQSVIHISGRHVRGTITEDLTEAGYPAKREIIYESIPGGHWPKGRLTHVALYSPMAAKTFAEMAVGRDVSSLITVSISRTTDEALEGLSVKSRLISDAPSEPALVRATLSA